MRNQWYYIAFLGSKTGGVYEKIERKGFNHIIIFYPSHADDTYFNTLEHVKTFVSYGIVERDALEEYLKDAIVLRVKSKRTLRSKWWWWIPTPDTCVTIAKQVLGVHKPFIWSPYQLYKHILKEHKWEAVAD